MTRIFLSEPDWFVLFLIKNPLNISEVGYELFQAKFKTALKFPNYLNFNKFLVISHRVTKVLNCGEVG